MAHYQQYGTRWLVLFVTFAISCVLWTLAAPLTPSATTAASFYGVSTAAVVWSSGAFPAAAVLGALPCMRLLDFVNFRIAQVICTALLLLGAGVRACSVSAEGTAAFAWVVVGQSIAGLGAPLLQASTTVIAASWFDDAVRGLANTLMCLSIPIGLYASALLHGLIDIDSPEDRASRIETLHYIHLGLGGLAALLSPVLLLAPPRRPCHTAAPQNNCNTPATVSTAMGSESVVVTPSSTSTSPHHRRTSLPAHPRGFNALVGMQARDSHTANNLIRRAPDDPVILDSSLAQAKRLLTQPVFLVLLAAFMLTFGALLVLVMFMFEFVGPYGVGFAKLAGGAGAVVFTAGFVGSMLDRTQAYRLIMGISQTVVVGLYIWFLISLPGSDDMLLPQGALVAISVVGFLAIPNSLELSAELSYPQTGAIAGILLWSACQGAVVVLVALFLYPLKDEGAETPHLDRARWLVLACLGTALCLWWIFFFVPIRHLRRAAERLYKDAREKKLLRAQDRAKKRRIRRNPSRSSLSRQSSRSSIARSSMDSDPIPGGVAVPMPSVNPDHDLYVITEESQMHTMTATLNSDIMLTRSDRDDLRHRGVATDALDSVVSTDRELPSSAARLESSSTRIESPTPTKAVTVSDPEITERGAASTDPAYTSLPLNLEQINIPSSARRALSERHRLNGASTSAATGAGAAAMSAASRRLRSRVEWHSHAISNESDAYDSASSQMAGALSDASGEGAASSDALHASRGGVDPAVIGTLLDASGIPSLNGNEAGVYRTPERPLNSGPTSAESAADERATQAAAVAAAAQASAAAAAAAAALARASRRRRSWAMAAEQLDLAKALGQSSGSRSWADEPAAHGTVDADRTLSGLTEGSLDVAAAAADGTRAGSGVWWQNPLLSGRQHSLAIEPYPLDVHKEEATPSTTSTSDPAARQLSNMSSTMGMAPPIAVRGGASSVGRGVDAGGLSTNPSDFISEGADAPSTAATVHPNYSNVLQDSQLQSDKLMSELSDRSRMTEAGARSQHSAAQGPHGDPLAGLVVEVQHHSMFDTTMAASMSTFNSDMSPSEAERTMSDAPESVGMPPRAPGSRGYAGSRQAAAVVHSFNRRDSSPLRPQHLYATRSSQRSAGRNVAPGSSHIGSGSNVHDSISGVEVEIGALMHDTAITDTEPSRAETRLEAEASSMARDASAGLSDILQEHLGSPRDASDFFASDAGMQAAAPTDSNFSSSQLRSPYTPAQIGTTIGALDPGAVSPHGPPSQRAAMFSRATDALASYGTRSQDQHAPVGTGSTLPSFMIYDSFSVPEGMHMHGSTGQGGLSTDLLGSHIAYLPSSTLRDAPGGVRSDPSMAQPSTSTISRPGPARPPFMTLSSVTGAPAGVLSRLDYAESELSGMSTQLFKSESRLRAAADQEAQALAAQLPIASSRSSDPSSATPQHTSHTRSSDDDELAGGAHDALRSVPLLAEDARVGSHALEAGTSAGSSRERRQGDTTTDLGRPPRSGDSIASQGRRPAGLPPPPPPPTLGSTSVSDDTGPSHRHMLSSSRAASGSMTPSVARIASETSDVSVDRGGHGLMSPASEMSSGLLKMPTVVTLGGSEPARAELFASPNGSAVSAELMDLSGYPSPGTSWAEYMPSALNTSDMFDAEAALHARSARPGRAQGGSALEGSSPQSRRGGAAATALSGQSRSIGRRVERSAEAMLPPLPPTVRSGPSDPRAPASQASGAASLQSQSSWGSSAAPRPAPFVPMAAPPRRSRESTPVQSPSRAMLAERSAASDQGLSAVLDQHQTAGSDVEIHMRPIIAFDSAASGSGGPSAASTATHTLTGTDAGTPNRKRTWWSSIIGAPSSWSQEATERDSGDERGS